MAYKKTNNKVATYGEQSDSVIELQKQLNAKGASLAVDGKYGDLTKAAFEKFNNASQPANPSTIPVGAISGEIKPLELAPKAPMTRMQQLLDNEAQNAISGLTGAQQKVAGQESQYSDILKALGTEQQFTNKQLDEQGVTAGQKRLAELQALAMRETNNLTSGILRNESNAIGTRETANFLGSQEARMRRESAINSLAIASEAAMVQGQTELAQANVDRMVKAVYEPMKMELEAARFNLSRLDKNVLEPAQRSKAEATERKLNYELKQVEKQQNFAEGLLKNGAPASIIRDVTNAESFDEAMIIPGIQKYMQSPLERAQLEKIRADISNMNSISSPGLTLKQRQGLLKDPTAKKAVGAIQFVKALDEYSEKMTKFKTNREDTIDSKGRTVKGGSFFGGDLSRQEKAASEQLVDSILGPALSLAQQQGVIQAGEADSYKKKLKVARLKGAKYVPAVASQIAQTLTTQIQNDFDFLDSSYPGASDSYQIFADYKYSNLPLEDLTSIDLAEQSTGETLMTID